MKPKTTETHLGRAMLRVGQWCQTFRYRRPADRQAHVIVAVPSAPLMASKLDVPGEYDRLRQAVLSTTPSLALARARPATLQRLSEMAALYGPVIVHFMGHGGFTEENGTPFLQFEKEDGDVSHVDAETMAQSLKGRTALVVLNACSMAQRPDHRARSFAQTLVDNGVPRVIAMQDEIVDEAALIFARAFYGFLAAGVGIEEALDKSRIALIAGGFGTAANLPILHGCTPLNEAVARANCSPALIDSLPRLELRAIPKPEGPFLGRQKELLALGRSFSTKGRRAQLITIVGSGGEGKTALARAACDRFAYHFPDGVFAVSVTPTSSRESVISRLAALLDVNPAPNGGSIEEAVLDKLGQGLTLIVVDGVEVVLDFLDHPDTTDIVRATDLIGFLTGELRERVSALLLTSRRPTGRPCEQVIHLRGLEISEGAALFLQCAPRRSENAKLLRDLIDLEVRDWDIQANLRIERLRQCLGLDDQLAEVYATAIEVSRRVDGHPLCLRLLGNAFDASNSAPANFLNGLAEVMREATDAFKASGDRQRTLHACIKASADALSPLHLELLRSLRSLTGFIIPEVVVAAWESPETRSDLYYLGVLTDLSEFENLEDNCVSLNPYHHDFCEDSPIYQMLHDLWKRSLLSRHELQARVNGNAFAAIVYKLVPAVWSYLQTDCLLSGVADDHDIAMAEAYGPLADVLISGPMNPVKAMIVSECIEDLLRLADLCGNQWRPRLFSALSAMLARLGRHIESMKCATKAAGAASDVAAAERAEPKPNDWLHDPDHAKCEAALASAQAAIRQGNIEDGIQQLDTLITKCQEKQEDYIVALARLTMGHALLTIGQLEGAISSFKITESYARNRKDWELCAEALDGLVLVYLGGGETLKALRTAEQALDTFLRPTAESKLPESGRSLSKEANILHNLAEAQRRLGRLEEAEKNYIKALHLRRQSKSAHHLPVTLHNLAQIYREYRKRNSTLADSNRELQYLAEALEASVAVENWAAQAAILIATAEVEQCTPQRHEELLLDAVKAAEKSGDVSLHAWALVAFAMALRQQGDRNTEALSQANLALELLCNAGLDRDVSGAPVASYKRMVEELEALLP